jgi:transcriptional regulator with XRE-family HTH domain
VTTSPSKTPAAPRRQLAHTRRSAGLTQDTLAELVGCDRSTVTRWEAGDTEPQPFVRPKLAEALHISLAELEALLSDFSVPPADVEIKTDQLVKVETPMPRPAKVAPVSLPTTSQAKSKPISHVNARIGARLRAEREARGWSKREMARRMYRAAGISGSSIESLVRQVPQWERGLHYPRDWSSTYAKAFDIEEAELFGGMMEPNPLTLGEEEEVERRQLLESLAMLGVATALPTQALETIRQAFNSSLLADSSDHTADDWQEVAYEYAHAYLVTPPQTLLPDLATDIVALRSAIDKSKDSPRLHDLYGAGATLGAIMAKTANSLGLTRESRHWWRSARHAADASGNRDLHVWVQGHESMSSLYQGGPYRLVLDTAESAIRRANGHASPGTLEAMAGKAQALAQLGVTSEAETVLGQMRDTFDALPSALVAERSSLLTWPKSSLLHTESFVYTATGHVKQAEKSQAAALAAYPLTMPRERALIGLHQAACLVQDGNITDGVTHAERILEGLPTEHHTRLVRIIAGKVLEAVPETETSKPSVSGYRERLALPSPTKGQE